MPIKIITGISECINDYDAFIMGINGVILNNDLSIENAIKTLRALSKHEKTIVLFSNTALRIHDVIKRLEIVNIPPSLYQIVISAGEEAHHHLLEKADPFHAALGSNCFFIGDTQETRFLNGLSLHRAHVIEEADFILAYGSDGHTHTLQDYRELLTKGLKLGLPLVCVNPNIMGIKAGKIESRPGLLAAYYTQRGGRVFYHGKPNRQMYVKLFDELGHFERKRMLIIGDSLDVDMKGAHAHHVDSLLLNSMILHKELLIRQKKISLEEISDILEKTLYHPKYLMSSLTY
jgi:HAD superfamily hydrolase (TIGR01459 family)